MLLYVRLSVQCGSTLLPRFRPPQRGVRGTPPPLCSHRFLLLPPAMPPLPPQEHLLPCAIRLSTLHLRYGLHHRARRSLPRLALQLPLYTHRHRLAGQLGGLATVSEGYQRLAVSARRPRLRPP